jgi:hypothetical protein
VATIRVAGRKRFTTVDQETVNDDRLSFRARGILLWLLDKPDDWSTDSERIAEAGAEGRDAVRAALNELQRVGYLEREKKQNEAGHWVTTWLVKETPTTDFQASVSQALDNRRSVSQALNNQRLIPNTRGLSQKGQYGGRFAGELDRRVRCETCGDLDVDCACPDLKLVAGGGTPT